MLGWSWSDNLTYLTKGKPRGPKFHVVNYIGRVPALLMIQSSKDEYVTMDEVEPAAIVNRLGYIIVGLRVAPDDWALPGTDDMVKRTIAGLTNPNPDERGQIVLLHDGGGDRQQTVDALPTLIHELRQRRTCGFSKSSSHCFRR